MDGTTSIWLNFLIPTVRIFNLFVIPRIDPAIVGEIAMGHRGLWLLAREMMNGLAQGLLVHGYDPSGFQIASESHHH